jgi:hypothetical protein
MTINGAGDITEGEWINRSQKGEVCGVMGCLHLPTSQCPKCKNHYCSGHLDLHVHKVANQDEANEKTMDERPR